MDYDSHDYEKKYSETTYFGRDNPILNGGLQVYI